MFNSDIPIENIDSLNHDTLKKSIFQEINVLRLLDKDTFAYVPIIPKL